MVSNICTSRPVSAVASVCVYQTMCAHPLVAICTTSEQAAALPAPSIWLLRSAILVTCQHCPCSKWNLTSVSSPPHTLCRWRCNQLSWPLNGADCSSTLKQTGEQNSNCFLYQDMVRDNNLVLSDYHAALFSFSFECEWIQLTGY